MIVLALVLETVHLLEELVPHADLASDLIRVYAEDAVHLVYEYYYGFAIHGCAACAAKYLGDVLLRRAEPLRHYVGWINLDEVGIDLVCDRRGDERLTTAWRTE